MDRIVDQTRFEEEQRAARAAENTGQEREEESLLDVGRKPKGLVWEVGIGSASAKTVRSQSIHMCWPLLNRLAPYFWFVSPRKACYIYIYSRVLIWISENYRYTGIGVKNGTGGRVPVVQFL